MVVFVHKFDVLKGNTLIWTNGDESALKGLEFTVLPSGIHTRSKDCVYFEVDGKPGIAIFKQNGQDLNSIDHHIDRDEVRMFSFGTLFDGPMDFASLSTYEAGMEAAFNDWWLNPDYKILERWDESKRCETTAFPFDEFCLDVGPLIIQLWRYALLQERILVLNKGKEVKKCNMLCHLLYEFGNMINSSYTNLMTLTMLDCEKLKDTESWCGTTSDEIIVYEEDLYDKLVTWDEDGIHFKDHNGEIKCNEVDFTIFKSLCATDMSSYKYQYESSIIWSKLIIDGLFMIFTGNLCKPWYHLEFEPVTDPNFYQYFSTKSKKIYTTLKEIIDSNPDQDTIYKNANLLIELELDYFYDSDFIRNISQKWFGKPIIPIYIDLSFTC